MKNELILQHRQQLSLNVMQKISLELLNRNQLELQEYLKEEASLNPFLEPARDEESVALPEEEEAFSGFDENWEIYSHSTSSHLPKDYSPDLWLEQLSGPRDWKEELLRDIRLSKISPQQEEILADIVEQLDDEGFLTDAKSLRKKHSLTEEFFEEILHLFFLLAPPGLGARTHGECFVLQLRARGLEDPLLEEIVTKHSEAVGKKDFDKALDDYELSPGEKKRFERILNSLSPRPVPDEETPVTALVPDLFIWRDEKGFRVEVSQKYQAYFTLNSQYVRMMQSPDMGQQDKKFLRKYYQNYMMIKTALERRRETLFKLGEMLIEKQSSFFEQGLDGLRPLSQAEAAEQMSVHPSTVSRAVKDKFVQTDFGLFPLGIFFKGVGGAVSSSSGEDVSRTVILKALKEMVDKEDKKQPLTDDEIAKKLDQMGYQVSRRAVNKYRGLIHIPPRKERRR
ncbi:MAG TPA: RNA polymerase sigma-54 factor [Firmicutes bacterium]|nr:RNA polymerase sigma-54 factor [Bacillota bacterium]